MAEPYLSKLRELLAALALPAGPEMVFETKHFFSGAALYANGEICASYTPAGFGLKLPADLRTGLLEAGAGYPLRYFPKAPLKRAYVVLSQAVLEDRERLAGLLLESAAYVLDRADLRR